MYDRNNKQGRFYGRSDLLDHAVEIAELLCSLPFVTGVGLFGSVARGAVLAHDVDLIIFDNGELSEQVITRMQEARGSIDIDMKLGELSIISITRALRVMGFRDRVEHLMAAYAAIPFDLVVVDERIRHDQKYLNHVIALHPRTELFQDLFASIQDDLLRFFPEGAAFRRDEDFARFVNDGCPSDPAFGGSLKVSIGDIAEHSDRSPK